jgi:tetratricopeptide (TPR) repeat protein
VLVLLVLAAFLPLQLGKYDLAIQDYTKALEVDPANSFAYYNRGITKDRMGDFEGAVADFSSAITLDPGNADFYHNRGFSLRKQVRGGGFRMSRRQGGREGGTRG